MRSAHSSNDLIHLAKRAGVISHSIPWARRFRAECPAVLQRLAAARRDGTLIAVRRAFRVGMSEGR